MEIISIVAQEREIVKSAGQSIFCNKKSTNWHLQTAVGQYNEKEETGRRDYALYKNERGGE